MELKEIAPYLAHRPQVKWRRPEDHRYMYSDLTISDYDFLIRKREGKLILFPLSDLTKPCLKGGGVPIVELANIAFTNHEWKLNGREPFAVSQKYGIVFEFDAAYGIFLRDDSANAIDQLSLFNWLYEHHFWLGDQDRFGEDIININSLKQTIWLF